MSRAPSLSSDPFVGTLHVAIKNCPKIRVGSLAPTTACGTHERTRKPEIMWTSSGTIINLDQENKHSDSRYASRPSLLWTVFRNVRKTYQPPTQEHMYGQSTINEHVLEKTDGLTSKKKSTTKKISARPNIFSTATE